MHFADAKRILGLLAFADVLDCAFVVEDSPIGVSSCAAILGDPDFGAVFPIHFVFEADDDAVFVQGFLKFLPQGRVDVPLALNILAAVYQLLRRIKAERSGQRWIDRKKAPLGRVLKNTLDRILED